jgi:hypothetical protein
VDSFLASFSQTDPPSVVAHDPLRSALGEEGSRWDAKDLVRTAKDLQAEAAVYSEGPAQLDETDQGETEWQDDEDYLDEDAIVRRAADEVALNTDDTEREGAMDDPGSGMSVQQESSTAPEESLIARLAALAALQPIEDDDAPGLPDAARTVSTFERLQGLSALVTAPINKVGSSRSDAKAPSRFSAPGLSADRDDDVDSWCSELAVTAARETLSHTNSHPRDTGICNQDASVICFGCDGEPYCTPCWKEGHPYDQMPKHRVKPFIFRKITS